MGSSTPSSPDNYNFTSTGDSDFHSFNGFADSFSFWVPTIVQDLLCKMMITETMMEK